MICLVAMCFCDECGAVASRDDFVVDRTVVEGEVFFSGRHLCERCRQAVWSDENEISAMQGAIQ